MFALNLRDQRGDLVFAGVIAANGDARAVASGNFVSGFYNGAWQNLGMNITANGAAVM
jgi:hypothetical protein